ncbi:MAG: response regulator [Proteobacteria bacterium]|nr:response regulator [Pseudomonadota bacterium]NIS70838.1 response regulator [Pseudomonadota bacterium]
MPKELLIADPNVTAQEEFEAIFEGTDSQLIFAENGEDALLKIKLYKPDLVIADVTMPNKDGFELCKIVKENSELSNTPFVLLAGIFEDIEKSDRERVGADGVITKPLKVDEILPLVKDLLKAKAIPLRAQEKAGEGIEEPLAEEALSGEEELPSIEGLEEMEVAAAEGVGEIQPPGKVEEEQIIELTDVVEEESPAPASEDERVDELSLEQVTGGQEVLPEDTALDDKALRDIDLDESAEELELEEVELDESPREGEGGKVEEPSADLIEDLEPEISREVQLAPEDEGQKEGEDTLLELEEVELEEISREEKGGGVEGPQTDLIEDLEIETAGEADLAMEKEEPSDEAMKAELEEEIDRRIDLALGEEQEEEDTLLDLEAGQLEEEFSLEGAEEPEALAEELGPPEVPEDHAESGELTGEEEETVLELIETEEPGEGLEEEVSPHEPPLEGPEEMEGGETLQPLAATVSLETLQDLDESSSEAIDRVSEDLEELSMEGLEDLGETVEDLEEFPFEDELEGLPGEKIQEAKEDQGADGAISEKDVEPEKLPPDEDMQIEEILEDVPHAEEIGQRLDGEKLVDVGTEGLREGTEKEPVEEGLEEARDEFAEGLAGEGLEEAEGSFEESLQEPVAEPAESGSHPSELIKEEPVSVEEIEAFQKRLSSDQDVVESTPEAVTEPSGDRIESLVRNAVEEALRRISESVIPELSKRIIQVASERIEEVVQEVVPELAEGAIKREIEKLQRGGS